MTAYYHPMKNKQTNQKKDYVYNRYGLFYKKISFSIKRTHSDELKRRRLVYLQHYIKRSCAVATGKCKEIGKRNFSNVDPLKITEQSTRNNSINNLP